MHYCPVWFWAFANDSCNLSCPLSFLSDTRRMYQFIGSINSTETPIFLQVFQRYENTIPSKWQCHCEHGPNTCIGRIVISENLDSHKCKYQSSPVDSVGVDITGTSISDAIDSDANIIFVGVIYRLVQRDWWYMY